MKSIILSCLFIFATTACSTQQPSIDNNKLLSEKQKENRVPYPDLPCVAIPNNQKRNNEIAKRIKANRIASYDILRRTYVDFKINVDKNCLITQIQLEKSSGNEDIDLALKQVLLATKLPVKEEGQALGELTIRIRDAIPKETE